MAKTANDILDEVAGSGLVAADVIENLRRQVAKATKPVLPAAIVKLLVERGHLTATQGEWLLTSPAASASSVAPVAALEELTLLSDDLGLAEDTPPPQPAAKPAPPAKPAALPTAKSLAAAPPAAKPGAASKSAIAKTKPPAPKPKAPAPKQPVEELQELVELPSTDELTPLEELPSLEGLVPLPDEDPLAGPAMADPFAQIAPGPLAPMPAAMGAPLAKPPAAARSGGGGKLLLMAAIAGILLVLGGGVIFALTRSNGDLEFDQAEQEYQNKQYSAAVAKFEPLLEKYPRNPKAAVARVHHGMAQIRGAATTPDDWPAILPVAKEVLTRLGSQGELTELHDEIAPLLTDMAVGLTEAARKGKTAEESSMRLAQAKEALALANDGRFVPGTLRPWQRLADLEETQALLSRDLGRDAARDQCLAAMRKEITDKQLPAAYAKRQALLESYPELADDLQLATVGQELAVAEAADLQLTKESISPKRKLLPSAVEGSLALAVSSPSAMATGSGRPFLALAGNSLWALDATSGKLLWQRSLGNRGQVAPVALSAVPTSDLLLIDSARSEVICVDPRSGAPRWQQALEGRLDLAPLVAGSRVFVTSRSGRMVALDAKSGDGQAALHLPQKVGVAPVASAKGDHIYQLANYSHLYVLSPDGLKCEDALYLGHEAGSVSVSPIVLPQHLVIAENRGIGSARLRVVALDEAGLADREVQQIEVPGQIITPPLLLGERLIVLTDAGSAMTLEYGSDASAPLKTLSESKLESAGSLQRQGMLQANRLWIADLGLGRYDVQPADGGLKKQWSGFADDVLEAPPQAGENLIFCLRKPAGGNGYVATAVQAESGQLAWETRLAAPLVGMTLSADGNSVTLTSSLAATTKVALGNLKGNTIADVPTPAAAKPLPAMAASVTLADGRLALIPAGSPTELLILDPDAPLPRPLPISDALGGKPIFWSGGLLVPCSTGSLHLYDPVAGGTLADPFQFPMLAGKRLTSCSACLTGEGDGECVVADGNLRLSRIGMQKEPQPHLVELASAKLELPMISPIASLGSNVYLVDQSGELRSFSLPDLKPGPSLKLDAKGIAFGPQRVGKLLLVSTDRAELVCLDGGEKPRWKIPLPYGPLAGAPMESGESLVLVSTTGTLWRIAADSGQELARVDLGQTLSGSPATAGSLVLVPTTDGCLLKVSLPEKEKVSP